MKVNKFSIGQLLLQSALCIVLVSDVVLLLSMIIVHVVINNNYL